MEVRVVEVRVIESLLYIMTLKLQRRIHHTTRIDKRVKHINYSE